MKYSKNFNRDFAWYLKMRHFFNFDGSLPPDIVFSADGIDGKQAFFLYDSQGKSIPTKHPALLATLIKIKGGVNLHIKMYAEDRASGLFPGLEFRALSIKLKAPYWFRDAVEHQKWKYVK
jgi:hypothetical protein